MRRCCAAHSNPRHQLMHIIRRHNTQIAQYLEISQVSQGIRALEMAQLVQLPLVLPVVKGAFVGAASLLAIRKSRAVAGPKSMWIKAD